MSLIAGRAIEKYLDQYQNDDQLALALFEG
jgi:hypothetical protein